MFPRFLCYLRNGALNRMFMKVNKISLFLLVACLFSVACGSAASYTRRYNPNAKSPLLDLPLEKRLELARKYLKVDY